MYTSYIGKKFLTLYNRRQKTGLTARQFFDTVFFPLFFEDNSHLMHVGNSPFFQKPKAADVEMAGGKAKAQLLNLHNAISTQEPNMSIFVGYAAKDVYGTTSGQVSSLPNSVSEEEMYTSWIGQALGIGVNGGLVMLIDHEDILWKLYSGWEEYRKQLVQTPSLKDKQIETWNGQWICNALDRRFNPAKPTRNWDPELGDSVGKYAILTKQWSEVLFVLAQKFSNQSIVAYTYNLSQTNTTLGFLKLFLPKIRHLHELRDKILVDQEKSALTEAQINKITPFFSLKTASKRGVIGLEAIEPRGLRDYMPQGTGILTKGKDYKFKDELSVINFQIFKLWIIAMLNNTELLNHADQLAQALIALEATSTRGKTIQSTLSSAVRESKTKRIFIDNLEKVLSEMPSHAALFKNLVEEILNLPQENLPLFITLVRFQYTYRKSNA